MSTHLTLSLWDLTWVVLGALVILSIFMYLALAIGRDQGEDDQRVWCEHHHLDYTEAIEEPPADPAPDGFIGWDLLEDAIAIAERQWAAGADIEELTAEHAARTETEIQQMTRAAEAKIGPVS